MKKYIFCSPKDCTCKIEPWQAGQQMVRLWGTLLSLSSNHENSLNHHWNQPCLEGASLNIPRRHRGLHQEESEKKQDGNCDLETKIASFKLFVMTIMMTTTNMMIMTLWTYLEEGWYWYFDIGHETQTDKYNLLEITWMRVDIGALLLRRQCFQRQSLSWPQKPTVIALFRLWKLK